MVDFHPKNHQEAMLSLEKIRLEYHNQLSEKLNVICSASHAVCASKTGPEGQEALAKLRSLAHNLTGSAGSFGLALVSQSARQLELHLNGLIETLPSFPLLQNDQQELTQRVDLLRKIDRTIISDPALITQQNLHQSPEFSKTYIKSVLLLEDNPDEAGLIVRLLATFNYKVNVIAETTGLKNHLNKLKPDVLIVDIIIGDDRDAGLSAVQALKGDGIIHCPVIFLSVREDIEARLEAVRGGADAYVRKPANMVELVDVIERLTTKLEDDPYRVLVIDDDIEIAKNNTLVFAAAGIRAEYLCDPMLAIKVIRTYRPDLLLMDIEMPQCNGLELTRLLNQIPQYMHIPIVFLSGSSEDEKKLQSLVAGGEDFLTKGVTPDKLVAMVRLRAERGRQLNNAFYSLKASEARFQAVSHAAGEAIICVDQAGFVVFWNLAAAENFGYSKQEILGHTITMLFEGKDRAELNTALQQCLETGTCVPIELGGLHRDGHGFPASVSFGAWQEESRVFVSAVIQDISKFIQAEHLLTQARDNAQSAAKSKSDFLANMSHEIRTPLNAIIGLSHLMARDQVSDRHKEKIIKIRHAGQHLLMLINDILDLSKIDAGKLELEQVPVRVEGLLSNVISILSEQARAKGLDLTIQTDPLPDNLLGDPTRLTQILVNLAGNAIKFTERGTVNLQTRLESDNEGTALVLFEVIDTGIGINAKARQHLFSAFDQADSSITRSYGGTGLGLALSLRLVEAMGGSIGVDSEPGKGSCFWFTVPFSKGESSELRQPQHASEQELETTLKRDYQGSRLLLVEDDPINQEVAVELLQSVGLQVVTADNGVEAIAKLKQGLDCQLVLMDMQMPVMDGLEATRRIRLLPSLSKLPIIAMTANAFAEDRRACFAAGMNDFSSKPVDPAALFETLIRWLPKPQISSQPAEQVPANHHDDDQGENEIDIDLLETLTSFLGLDMEQGLRSIGNLFKFVKLLKKFKTLNMDNMQQLQELQEKGQREDARRLVHSTKGSAGTLGLVDLQAASAELEQSIKTEAPEQQVALLKDKYEDELKAVIDLVERLSEG